MQLRFGALLTVIFVLTAGVVVGAAPSREDLARIEARAKARQRDLETFRAQATEARRDVNSLRSQLIQLASEQNRSEQTASDSRAKLVLLNLRESELANSLGKNQNQLSRLLAALQLYGRNPPPALLVHPSNAKDAVRAAILMRAITPELHNRAKGFSAEVQEIARVRRETAAASEALFTAESDIADRRGKIEALLQEKAALEQAVTADAQLASDDLKRLAARAKSLRELLQGLPRQASPSAKGEPQGPSAGPEIRNSRFINPSAGSLIRRFGQTAPRTGAAGGGRSEGWTWRTEKGASVRAPIQGTVEYAGPLKGWGMVLILRLGGGYHLVLAGMDQTTAEAGRTLSAGEPVGRMGDQDRPTPELYMEIRRDGSPVDPARWMASLRATGAG
jgi:septal ring factor EnvC (AmiA/AmiB activator)